MDLMNLHTSKQEKHEIAKEPKKDVKYFLNVNKEKIALALFGTLALLGRSSLSVDNSVSANTNGTKIENKSDSLQTKAGILTIAQKMDGFSNFLEQQSL
jgi:hypothetical protein